MKAGAGAEASYEVRTRGWSCSCAAFAFAAFGGAGSVRGGGVYGDRDGWGGGDEGDEGDDEEGMLLGLDEGRGGDERLEGGEEWRWGGLMLEGDVPLCKHLLACVLAERWTVAGAMVEEREVGREEMAGWAAGWGG